MKSVRIAVYISIMIHFLRRVSKTVCCRIPRTLKHTSFEELPVQISAQYTDVDGCRKSFILITCINYQLANKIRIELEHNPKTPMWLAFACVLPYPGYTPPDHLRRYLEAFQVKINERPNIPGIERLYEALNSTLMNLRHKVQ